MRAVLAMAALAGSLSACAGPGARVQAQSVADARASAAVAEQVRRCYRDPRIPSSGRRIVTRLVVRYAPDGKLLELPLLASQQNISAENRPYAGRMAEAARLAVIRCSPVRLPRLKGEAKGIEFFLTFSPQLAA